MFTRYGGGRHLIFVTDHYMVQIVSQMNEPIGSQTTTIPNESCKIQCSILAEAFYGLSMGFLKLSLLSLYSLIFPQRRFHYLLWGVAAFIVGWSLTSFFGSILQCVPIEKATIPSLPGHCISYPKLSLTMTVCNVVTDLVIIALPIPLVLNLNAANKTKVIIILSFTAGCR